MPLWWLSWWLELFKRQRFFIFLAWFFDKSGAGLTSWKMPILELTHVRDNVNSQCPQVPWVHGREESMAFILSLHNAPSGFFSFVCFFPKIMVLTSDGLALVLSRPCFVLMLLSSSRELRFFSSAVFLLLCPPQPLPFRPLLLPHPMNALLSAHTHA